jgi:drug/metabolite transporter (DMT)-like permease
MGLVAPLTALISAAVPAVVGIVGGDPTGPALLAGMGIALGAVVLLSVPEPGPAGEVRHAWRGSAAREWLLIVASGLGLAGFYLGVDRAYDAGGSTWWTLAGIRACALLLALATIGALLAAGRGPRMRVPRVAIALGVIAGVGDTSGNLFLVLARAAGSLSVTVVLASLYPVSTALLARFVLHERLSRLRIVGVGLALAGAVLISAGSLEG